MFLYRMVSFWQSARPWFLCIIIALALIMVFSKKPARRRRFGRLLNIIMILLLVSAMLYSIIAPAM